MVYQKREVRESFLGVYEDRSVYHTEDGSVEVYYEGKLSIDANKRAKFIKDKFKEGFLDGVISDLQASKITVDTDKISQVTQDSLRELVDLVTSEVGRALVGLSVMQLCIKAISPEQNVRLHKGSVNRGSFSWIEGISMRTLDKNFVTPTLRKHDLLRLNADGFMMTRSLAENYPYSPLYKANLRGAKKQWLALVEELESAKTDPMASLQLLVSLLINAATSFVSAADELLILAKKRRDHYTTIQSMYALTVTHAERSDYAARLFEVSMHTLMQGAVESGALGYCSVKPLSQMRSANKKHGNIADVELIEDKDIVEAWDAKYGKGYLREEVEEIIEKIPSHDHLHTIGFVTSGHIERSSELEKRIDEISELHGIELKISTYLDWINHMFDRCVASGLVDEQGLCLRWFNAYVESLCQKRREQAPIDEPCLQWIRSLTALID